MGCSAAAAAAVVAAGAVGAAAAAADLAHPRCCRGCGGDLGGALAACGCWFGCAPNVGLRGFARTVACIAGCCCRAAGIGAGALGVF